MTVEIKSAVAPNGVRVSLYAPKDPPVVDDSIPIAKLSAKQSANRLQASCAPRRPLPSKSDFDRLPDWARVALAVRWTKRASLILGWDTDYEGQHTSERGMKILTGYSSIQWAEKLAAQGSVRSLIDALFGSGIRELEQVWKKWEAGQQVGTVASVTWKRTWESVLNSQKMQAVTWRTWEEIWDATWSEYKKINESAPFQLSFFSFPTGEEVSLKRAEDTVRLEYRRFDKGLSDLYYYFEFDPEMFAGRYSNRLFFNAADEPMLLDRLRRFRRDYDVILDQALANKWTDETPVSQDEFGPLN